MMNIGQTIWFFDQNRRVYEKKDGRAIGGAPIWREHWRPEKIVSETSRSWVTDGGQKVPKSGARPWGVAISEEEISERAYVHDHARKIGEAVSRLNDHDLLKRVAELVNYKSAP